MGYKYVCYDDSARDKVKKEATITYGSYADGSANENSDFDALLIAESSVTHDSSAICDTVLDVFVYSPDVFETEYNPEEFVQLFDGKMVGCIHVQQ